MRDGMRKLHGLHPRMHQQLQHPSVFPCSLDDDECPRALVCGVMCFCRLNLLQDWSMNEVQGTARRKTNSETVQKSKAMMTCASDNEGER